MFHYIKGKVKRNQSDCFIFTEMFGVQVAYAGGQSEGEFFLYPYLDEGKKSVFYCANPNLRACWGNRKPRYQTFSINSVNWSKIGEKNYPWTQRELSAFSGFEYWCKSKTF